MEKSFLDSILPGEKLRLRDDVLPYGKVREWLFVRAEGENIFLAHETQGYIWKAKMGDVDWKAYQKSKEADNRRHRRHLLKMPIKYYLADVKGSRSAYLLDLSEEGLSADLPEKLEEGQTLRLDLPHLSQAPIEIMAEIVWTNRSPRKEEMYQSGMKIVQLSPENKSKLRNLSASFP